MVIDQYSNKWIGTGWGGLAVFNEVSIYNLLGQKVATLVSGRQQTGYHRVEWNASGFPSDFYYYRIQAGDFRDVKKMILLR
ncbi:T9SS type A sorting domain-containing protein [bacterium]|nr:T9SS type A sorting domain-containing protein [bacterium]